MVFWIPWTVIIKGILVCLWFYCLVYLVSFCAFVYIRDFSKSIHCKPDLQFSMNNMPFLVQCAIDSVFYPMQSVRLYFSYDSCLLLIHLIFVFYSIKFILGFFFSHHEHDLCPTIFIHNVRMSPGCLVFKMRNSLTVFPRTLRHWKFNLKVPLNCEPGDSWEKGWYVDNNPMYLGFYQNL